MAVHHSHRPGPRVAPLTGGLLLTDAVRPAPGTAADLRPGYRIDVHRDRDRGLSIPVLTAAVSQEHLLDAFLAQAPDRAAFFARPDFFDRLAGTPRLRTMLTAGRRPAAVAAAWAAELRRFETRTRPYRLYP